MSVRSNKLEKVIVFVSVENVKYIKEAVQQHIVGMHSQHLNKLYYLL